ncbi:hypothetical protein SDC9_88558 [bioreactor metagenome]|uniref:Uncharacterized protein n=1 Tax=bioreactor metagenome TaxID=1076179 RepID=A0A644ZNF5_9ZZZZ
MDDGLFAAPVAQTQQAVRSAAQRSLQQLEPQRGGLRSAAVRPGSRNRQHGDAQQQGQQLEYSFPHNLKFLLFKKLLAASAARSLLSWTPRR